MNNDNNDNKDINIRSNNDDPLLRFDALMAGVKNGGLRSKGAINLLVCYIVSNLEGRVKAETITTALEESELANYFEVAGAISKMLKSGVIVENENTTLSLGDTKGAPIDMIEKDLPLTVREESIRLCQKIIAKEDFKRENKVEINENENGYEVVLYVSDDKNDYMRLTLFASTIEQAEVIRDKFITNPVAVYETLIDSIFDNE